MPRVGSDRGLFGVNESRFSREYSTTPKDYARIGSTSSVGITDPTRRKSLVSKVSFEVTVVVPKYDFVVSKHYGQYI